MTEELRQEPVLEAKDDIPIIRNRIEAPWVEILAYVRKIEPENEAFKTPTVDMREAKREALEILANRLAPAVTAAVEGEIATMLDDVVGALALRLKGDLSRQVNALVVKSVHEELGKILDDERAQ
ncbi:MAG TPA: hypothetical protein DCW60_01105 [Sutterella sp.]|nr:hypothetical protein [Sutterella sp.]